MSDPREASTNGFLICYPTLHSGVQCDKGTAAINNSEVISLFFCLWLFNVIALQKRLSRVMTSLLHVNHARRMNQCCNSIPREAVAITARLDKTCSKNKGISRFAIETIFFFCVSPPLECVNRCFSINSLISLFCCLLIHQPAVLSHFLHF